MGFKVGQKVVCVNDKFDTANPDFFYVFKELPKFGETYTIRESDSPSVKLEEIVNPQVQFDLDGLTIVEEGAFNENRFVPLQSMDQVLEEEYELVETI